MAGRQEIPPEGLEVGGEEWTTGSAAAGIQPSGPARAWSSSGPRRPPVDSAEALRARRVAEAALFYGTPSGAGPGDPEPPMMRRAAGGDTDAGRQPPGPPLATSDADEMGGQGGWPGGGLAPRRAGRSGEGKVTWARVVVPDRTGSGPGAGAWTEPDHDQWEGEEDTVENRFRPASDTADAAAASAAAVAAVRRAAGAGDRRGTLPSWISHHDPHSPLPSVRRSCVLCCERERGGGACGFFAPFPPGSVSLTYTPVCQFVCV